MRLAKVRRYAGQQLLNRNMDAALVTYIDYHYYNKLGWLFNSLNSL